MEHDADGATPEWDVFISHASEDKDAVVRPLAEELRGRGVRVWYDEYELKIGDSLRTSIEQGLAQSRRGIVIISPDFFKKHWTREELNGLTALEAAAGAHRVLPVWHNIDHAEVASQAPMLADRVAATTDLSIPELAVKLIEALGADGSLEDRLLVVALSVEVTKVTASVVSVMLRNVGSTHAMHVSLEPRRVEGRGVPLTVGYSEAIPAGASHVIELERFPPQDAQADALYDLLYADPGELVLKQQRLHFFLAPDVVTGGSFDGLAMEREGPEATFRRDSIEPWPDGAETLVQAWLFSQDWLLTGSTGYLRALRTLHGASVDP
jgi:TIR domain